MSWFYFYDLSHFILLAYLWGRCYYSHFVDAEVHTEGIMVVINNRGSNIYHPILELHSIHNLGKYNKNYLGKTHYVCGVLCNIVFKNWFLR